MTIGLSIGLGGVGAPLLGLLADAHGLRVVFELMAVFPVAAMLLSLALPSRRDPEHSPVSAASRGRTRGSASSPGRFAAPEPTRGKG